MSEDITLGALLRRSAKEYADVPFIGARKGDGQAARTFARFDADVDRVASGLLDLGVKRGDHIAVWLTNSTEWVLTLLAAARIGAAVIPVNTRYKKDEAAYIIAQSDAKVLVMTPSLWGIDFVGMLRDMAPDIDGQDGRDLKLANFPFLKSVVMVSDEDVASTVRFDALRDAEVDAARLAAAEGEVRSSDMLLICYTSGTTGRPKGAMHSHRVIKQATRVGEALRMGVGARVLVHLPFYHVAGMFMCLIPSIALGSTMHIMGHWNARDALDIISREKVSVFGGLATHYLDMMQVADFDAFDLSSLEGTWAGGSTLPPDIFSRIIEKFRIERLLSTYGMTENTISTTFNRWDDPLEDCRRNNAPILADCEVIVVDPETGDPRPVGQEGEIWCRGETVMLGYYKNPEATRETITAEGWLRTGDVGRFDERGYLSLTGRIKEMFKVGGTNAYPAEIEQHLATHPDVNMSIVVGAPDRRLVEVGLAFVQRKPGSTVTADDIVAHCKGRIADYKVPRYVVFVDGFPLTTTGKVQRAELVRAARDHVENVLSSKGAA